MSKHQEITNYIYEIVKNDKYNYIAIVVKFKSKDGCILYSYEVLDVDDIRYDEKSVPIIELLEFFSDWEFLAVEKVYPSMTINEAVDKAAEYIEYV